MLALTVLWSRTTAPAIGAFVVASVTVPAMTPPGVNRTFWWVVVAGVTDVDVGSNTNPPGAPELNSTYEPLLSTLTSPTEK
jgi:hypothetical protein